MTENKSYKQIVKSTSIFGGSQVINILIGFIRTKIIAILLGTTGVGLIGMYQTIIDMIKSIAVLGLDTSGIRDIATANSTGNKKMINESVSILRKWMSSLSIFAALICILFAYPIALWSFNKEEADSQTFAIAALSISILFVILGISRTVVLQGLRKIPEMVKSNVLGNLVGLFASIPLYYFWGTKGIVPSLILGSIIIFLSTTYFSRKIEVEDVHISLKNAYKKGGSMFKMGIFIVMSSIFETASVFVVRAFISKQAIGDELGIFTASWTITNVYLALILRSMGSDFYPRLCGVASNKIQTRRLVDEQTLMILIISSPLIVGMLLAADFIIPILYTSSFVDVSGILRWQVFATFFKVISWPLGFILLARGKGLMHLFTNLFFIFIYLGIGAFLFSEIRLSGLGISFFIAYIAYFGILIFITNFRWTKNVFRFGIIYLLLVATAFYLTNVIYCLWGAALVFLMTTLLSIYKFNSLIPLSSLRRYFLKK